MPSGRDWTQLFRTTFGAVGREDMTGLYSVEWKRAKEKLIAEDHPSIEREPKPPKRILRTINSILFGLALRLAPARRVLFLVVLLCIFMSMCGPEFHDSSTTVESGVRRTTSYSVDLDSTFLVVSTVLLGLLLAMELVDKINYRDELELARDLQASLIPKSLPRVPAYALGAHNEIANTVGGDIYDFVPLPDGRLAVLFGDASGHGMAAGLIMAVSHAAFRTQLEVDPSPAAMFATLNRILCRTGSPRAFFGCLYFLFSEDGRFVTAAAGHPPALRVGPDGAVRERVGRGAYPLGIRPGLTWPEEHGRLEAGETLLFHSDGLPEARNAADEDFGDQRIAAALLREPRLPPQERVDFLARELHAFLLRQVVEDDVSIAVVERVPIA